MRSQCFAQDRVKNVGARVIRSNAPPPFLIDLGLDFVTDAEFAEFHFDLVDNDASNRRNRYRGHALRHPVM